MVEVIKDVINEHIQLEIEQSPFISVQADETLDVSCKCQMSIIFRLCVKERIEERFVGFFDVSRDKSARGLADVVLNVIEKWNVKNKLISQTYDGASVMAGREGGLQHYVKEKCPNAIFVHCYAHQLNLVLLHGAKYIKHVKLFICDLTAFNTFFSKSSKRTSLLTDQGFKLPQASDTRWNYHSRGVSTIKFHFTELYRIFDSIIICEDNQNQWDPHTINCAIGLKRRLDDKKFVYFLNLYHLIFIYVDHVYKVLQSKQLSNILTSQNEINIALKNIKTLRNEKTVDNCIKMSQELNSNLIYDATLKTELRKNTYEILDSIIVQMEIRLDVKVTA